MCNKERIWKIRKKFNNSLYAIMVSSPISKEAESEINNKLRHLTDTYKKSRCMREEVEITAEYKKEDCDKMIVSVTYIGKPVVKNSLSIGELAMPDAFEYNIERDAYIAITSINIAGQLESDLIDATKDLFPLLSRNEDVHKVNHAIGQVVKRYQDKGYVNRGITLKGKPCKSCESVVFSLTVYYNGVEVNKPIRYSGASFGELATFKKYKINPKGNRAIPLISEGKMV